MHDILALCFHLLERLGALAIVFFLLMRLEPLRRRLTGAGTIQTPLLHGIAFGLAGVIANYLGFPFHGALANLRTVPVALAGILGGPVVGLLAGTIAGVHRYFLDVGGFTSLSCGAAAVVQGVVAGLVYRRVARGGLDTFAALAVGVLAESTKLGFILLLAYPFDRALALVHTIALPSLFANAAGVAILVELLATVKREQERARAAQAQIALDVAFRTLPHLRNGLGPASAGEAARIIRDATGLDAVALSSESAPLAHEGAGCAHHRAGAGALTRAARRALETGEPVVARTRAELGCPDPACPLGSGIVVPLQRADERVGTLALYRAAEHRIDPADEELARGLAQLFSHQVEFGELERQRRLALDAEIRALQAQINPHFLFNAISTIKSHTRTDPELASELLVRLAAFFRRNIATPADRVPLADELEHCEAYVAIERARFEERLSVVYDVDEVARGCLVPPLMLQPLVENGVRHGVLPREQGGVVRVDAHRAGDDLLVTVSDDGVGMTAERIRAVLSERGPLGGQGLGLALRNVNARLAALYGQGHALRIDSAPGQGTVVRFSIPAVRA